MTVIFKDIPGYEGIYSISECGQVKSLPRLIKSKTGNYYSKEKIIKLSIGTTGYYFFNVCINGKAKSVAIHKMVALTFIGSRPENMDIRHLDGNKLNNHISNLCYGTRQQNIEDTQRHGNFKITNKKLSEKDIIKIRKSKISYKELAKKYNVKINTIKHVRSNISWFDKFGKIERNIKRNENHPMAKLSNLQVRKILKSNKKYKDIAIKYNVSYSSIEKIKRWYTWMIKN